MGGKVFIYVFITLLKFGCKNAEVGTDMMAEIVVGDKIYTTKLASCTLNPGDLKGLSVKGLKGNKGDQGFPGLSGEKGFRGYDGLVGPIGMKGDKGDAGYPGPTGSPGRNGRPGPRGEKGETGAPGEDGRPGEKGAQGSIGISGTPGLNGICKHVCPHPVRAPLPGTPPDGLGGLGTFYDPVDGLCNIIRSEDDKFKETIWVNPKNSFEVRCDAVSLMTCLKTKPMNKYNGDGAFYVNETEPFWLSERRYNLTKFYGVPLEQIAWLQQKSTQISQTIRYHCKNSYITENQETALILYGWNDLTIGPYSSYGPLTYHVPRETHKCNSDAPKTEWRYSDIVILSNHVKRLPVVDFRIKDIREEESQRFYLELVELCFG